ncbi:uncharacterized protein EKO05_0007741 [Ascochyta rabiei]|uniref:Uncharacterized protein n=1 Tax=Didymella rabiei TaxID=5454 RepID=A0A163CCJ5_DIDRA|nr:uncharacterized protein EKO05_0007741 [Ascochyta rabiei]KZM22364.1 hypothetical protein ST47_g6498 [Ascochyta rabiei]UPX17381.1 hypothetical protein EKO05_0007741 [Ascochyta rabiei]
MVRPPVLLIDPQNPVYQASQDICNSQSFPPARRSLTTQLENNSSIEPTFTTMSPFPISSPGYDGPKSLSFSKYASPGQRTQLAAASAVPMTAIPSSETTIATKQQIAATGVAAEMTPPAAELAVQQGAKLKKQVEDHAAKFANAVSSTATNTRQLLALLRESVPGSEAVDDLWKELEQLFEAANDAKAALPTFLEKQRDSMSLYHSSMMNETICETQQELKLQHKKINTQHSLILEQQDAFQQYKEQTNSKVKELESLQERVSRLTLEKGNFRTEVDKYKGLLEQEVAKKAEDFKTANALQKELEILVSSNKQLQVENETLRKTTTDMLDQLKGSEQRVTARFTKELKIKAEELEKETVKAASLGTLVNTLKIGEGSVKNELEKVKTENRLLSVKYNNLASEHAATFTKVNEQTKKIQTLIADGDRLLKQNTDMQTKLEKATGLAKTSAELSKIKEDLSKQVENLVVQLDEAKDEVKKGNVQLLKAKQATKDDVPAAGNVRALLEKVKRLEEKKEDLEAALSEWTELAKRSYKEYKDMLPTYRAAEEYRQDAHEKEAQVHELKLQLAAAKASQSNGVGAGGGDATYWKQKYESLLSTIG